MKVTQRVVACRESQKIKETRKILDRIIDQNKRAIIYIRSLERYDLIREALPMYRDIYFLESFEGEAFQASDCLKDTANSFLLVHPHIFPRVDIKGVDAIILFDMPPADVYTQIVGRMGNVNGFSEVSSILTERDSIDTVTLVNFLRDSDQFVPDEIEHMAKSELPPPSKTIPAVNLYRVPVDLPKQTIKENRQREGFEGIPREEREEREVRMYRVPREEREDRMFRKPREERGERIYRAPREERGERIYRNPREERGDRMYREERGERMHRTTRDRDQDDIKRERRSKPEEARRPRGTKPSVQTEKPTTKNPLYE